MDAEGKTALHIAVESGSDQIVYLLLEHEANKNARDDTGQKPMSYASKDSSAYWLFKNGCEPDDADRNGDTFLHWAIKKREVDAVDWLLTRGECDINGEDAEGSTPLINAVSRGFRDIAKMLLDHKADIRTKDKNGYPPLILAARNGHYATVKLLLDKGAGLEDAGPKLGQRALFEAVEAQKADVVRLLLSHGAEVNAHNNEGWTALAIISCRGKIDIMQQLVEAGADVNDPGNYTNHRALPEACWWQANHAVAWLLDRGADINQRVPGDETVLISAAGWNRIGTAQLLLRRGADTSLRDDHGRTALDVAQEKGNKQIEYAIVAHLEHK